MTKVTDRLDSQNLINLARQNYEKQQRTKVPGYIVPLPSAGLIYPESSVLRQGVVEMRHMTAYDEDILTNSTYISNGIMLHKLIESLLITPDISADDLSNADLEALVIYARIHAYGKEIFVSVIDPNTSKVIERAVDLTKLTTLPFNLQSDENGEFEFVTSTGDILKFKYISVKDTKSIDSEHTLSDFLKKSIQSINGNRDRNHIEEFVKFNFLAADARSFRKYILDNMHGLDYNMEFEGEDGSTFISRFQLGSNFFWF